MQPTTALTVALILIGALVGAGFASGQEIMHFFVRFGPNAFLGAIVSVALFATFSLGIAFLCQRKKLPALAPLLAYLAGHLAGNIFLHLLNLFMWFGLTVMLAGADALLASFLPTFGWTITLLTGVLIFAVALKRQQGLQAASRLLIPFLLFAMGFFFFRALLLPEVATAAGSPASGWCGSAVLYFAANSAVVLTLVPELLAAVGRLKVFLKGVVGAAGGTLLLLLVAIFLLRRFVGLDNPQELPLLAVTSLLLPQCPALYALLLYVALITTAFANAHSLQRYFSHLWSPRIATKALFLAVAAALVSARFGIIRLVASLYPLTGYCCLLFYAYSFFYHLIGFDSR